MWIVKATCSNGAMAYLPDYAGISRWEVAAKVMERAGCKGTVAERLAELKWEIVQVKIEEVS